MKKAGVISRKEGHLTVYPEKPTGAATEGQQMFFDMYAEQMDLDQEICHKRGLLTPFDAEPGTPERTALEREAVYGAVFAILQEIDEVHDAIQEGNQVEECIDLVHFILGLAIKLDMPPTAFAYDGDLALMVENADHAWVKDWIVVVTGHTPFLIKELNNVLRHTFKWWKNQPEVEDWEPTKDALIRLMQHIVNMLVSQLGRDASAIRDAYLHKRQENSDRQAGLIAGRESYEA